MRVRVRFTKLGKLCWTSHRDVARMWERAVRRAGLGLVYTEGFSPRPKISFGLALPTGHQSVAEYLDIELAQPVGAHLGREAAPEVQLAWPAAPEAQPIAGPEDLVDLLGPALPDGMDVLAAGSVEAGTRSLQEEVTSCSWQIELVGLDRMPATDLVETAMAAKHLSVVRERKGRPTTDDIRPALRSLTVFNEDSSMSGPKINAVLYAELLTQPRGVRPSELIRAIAPELELGRVWRTHQWIERDGARREPLPLGPPDAPHAYERAS